MNNNAQAEDLRLESGVLAQRPAKPFVLLLESRGVRARLIRERVGTFHLPVTLRPRKLQETNPKE